MNTNFRRIVDNNFEPKIELSKPTEKGDTTSKMDNTSENSLGRFVRVLDVAKTYNSKFKSNN